MSAFAIFAIAWIPISCGVVVGLVYLGIWLEGRLERRKPPRAFGWRAHVNG